MAPGGQFVVSPDKNNREVDSNLFQGDIMRRSKSLKPMVLAGFAAIGISGAANAEPVKIALIETLSGPASLTC